MMVSQRCERLNERLLSFQRANVCPRSSRLKRFGQNGYRKVILICTGREAAHFAWTEPQILLTFGRRSSGIEGQ